MKQKKTWKRYLHIGTSIFSLFFFTNCTRFQQVEYRLDTDIIYKNETSHFIRYYQFDSDHNQKILVFELNPNSEKKMEIRGDGGNENQTIDNCCQGILEGYQGIGSILINFDQSKCLIYEDGTGPTTSNLNNGYNGKELSNGTFQFTYTFTEEEYTKATDCE